MGHAADEGGGDERGEAVSSHAGSIPAGRHKLPCACSGRTREATREGSGFPLDG
jgi:hypothetical protein